GTAADAAEDAEQCQQQLLLALAIQAAEADDLALADLEIDTVEAVLPFQPGNGEMRRARFGCRLLWKLVLDVTPDHQPHDVALRLFALGEGLDVAAIAEHREGVAERLHLVHAVGDEQHAGAGAPQLLEQARSEEHTSELQSRENL